MGYDERKQKTGGGLPTLFLILILFTVAAVCAACVKQESPPVTDSPKDASVAPLPRYAMIVKEKENQYMINMYTGFENACKELGVEAVMCGPESYEPEAQIDIIERLIESRVEVIAIAANHTDLLEDALKTAMDAGITVVSVDSSVNPDSRMVHIQQADPEKVGRVLVQAASRMVDGAGVAAVISSTQYATNQNQWLYWIEQEYADNPLKYKDFTLLDVRYGDDSAEKTILEMDALFREHPDINVVIALSAVSMPVIGRYLKNTKQPAVYTGLGQPSAMSEYVLDGICPSMYLWNPIDLGYLAAYSSNALSEGGIAADIGDTFNAGRLGLRSVSAAADGGTEILLGNPVKFDAENIVQWRSVY
ncbi:MAG: substrate-binding domain-containing protein [Clostridiales Family XIII bacterium]|jgi:rhamnose transport system substrate-binding protein|nr:substrate-binding domain-containing protein [Clostridiales Family XIII bacterium]